MKNYESIMLANRGLLGKMHDIDLSEKIGAPLHLVRAFRVAYGIVPFRSNGEKFRKVILCLLEGENLETVMKKHQYSKSKMISIKQFVNNVPIDIKKLKELVNGD